MKWFALLVVVVAMFAPAGPNWLFLVRLSLLTLFLAVGLSGCEMARRAIVKPPIVDCGPAATRYCASPIYSAPNYLESTEAEDAENRSIWLVCATDHRVTVQCLKTLDAAGVITLKKYP